MKTHSKRITGLSARLRFCISLVMAMSTSPVFSYSLYLTGFNNHYGTQGTRLDSCGLCHVDFNGGGPRTLYGEDFRNNNYNPANIGQLDSDGDGFSNDQEAASSTLTFPGYSCNDFFIAINAPANIADYIDPSNPGCIGPGQPPVVNINGPYSGVTGDIISFSSAGSYDPDGSISSYLWDFGSYGSSTLANPQMSFSSSFSARLNFTLTITDNDGNRSTASSSVTILMSPNSPPLANAGPAVSGTVGSPLQFNGTASVDPEGKRLWYTWDFGDQHTATGAMPVHSYAHCGTYTVNLTVSDNVNLQGHASTTAQISGDGVTAPVANAGGGTAASYTGNLGSNILFDASASYDPDCNIVSYDWNFGDGSTAQGISPLHNYAQAGAYVVSLTVTDTDGLSATSTASVTVVDTGPLNGQLLYDNHCSSCHGPGSTSTKIGATVSRINTGINSVPAMTSLASLSAAEIQAIADFLTSMTAPPPAPPPSGPIDGALAYDNNCGACHGLGNGSSKAGATVARINTGISSVAAMASLSSLSSVEIQAIADFLMSLAPPSTPQGLYTSYCASCHGTDGSGGTSGKNVIGDSASKITKAIAKEAPMQSLSFLSNSDIQAIADFLMGVTSTPGNLNGQSLYDTNCAGCHGLSSNSAKAGADATRINNGIATVASMSYFATALSAAEIQAIGDFLVSLAPTPPPATGGGTGADLYASHCAACHGAGSNSSKAGATLSRINNGISSVASMGFLANLLTTADIQSIADFLSTSPLPSTPQEKYVSYCGSCHGANGQGGSSGKKVAGASAKNISKAIRKEKDMLSLAFLGSTDISDIATYLKSLKSKKKGKKK